jgi:CRISPR/Cas system-associated exonuclease Cas4 (RecB family)
MTSNLLKQVMIKKKEADRPEPFLDEKELISKIETGYVVNNIPKHTQKKTFAPSTIAYNHGECARYWYLAFDGVEFEDNSDAYGVANRTNGTLSHARIQQAMMDAGIANIYRDEDNQETTEFKIINQDPGIFGYGDVMLKWDGEDVLGEIKTVPNEGFEYRKNTGKAKTGHLIQILIYMKILGKKKAVLIYENKNNHELLVIPVQVNDYYRKWVEDAFEWMRTVKKAWKDRTIPQKNYRSNSKICKNCPIQKACASAEAGTIKIAALEELSEAV